VISIQVYGFFKKNFFEIYKFIIPNGFSLTTTITLSGLINEHRVRFIPIDYYSRSGKSKIRPIYDTVNFFKIIMRIGLYYQPKKVFGPINIFFFIGFILSASFDIFVEFNISDKTVLLLNTLLTMIAFTFIAELITRKDVKR